MEQKIDIKTFLDNDEKKDLLRFLTAGSVDDGKSTLIGRLLFDSKKIYEDQLDALERDSKRVGNAGDHIDYALLLDGLKAEREQGITIDVAYRYFSTNKRKFIIADTPGHEQYTRNMITGGSTANLAVILVDARTGVITQTRRHSFLVSLLGIKHVVLAVNKMDLVDFSEERFNEIVTEYKQFVSKLNIPDVQYIPLSALEGDNVVKKSDVQYVLRPNLDFRGFSAKVASGVVHKGDEVMVLPSMKKTKVKEIVTYDGNLDYAFPPQSVTLTLEDEIDISRGDMLVHPDNLPLIGRTFEAMLVWMDEEDMDVNKQFFIKQTTNTSRVRIDGIRYKVDVNTMSQSKVDKLKLNEIGRAVFTTNRPLYFDPYVKNKSCGAFILIDPITNNTSAVGMIIDKADLKDLFTAITDEDKKKMISGESLVSSAEWKKRLEQDGKVFWITGEDKSYVRLMVYTLERRLYDIGKIAVILNLDSTGIEGMTPRDVALMAHKLSNRGIIVICCGSELSMANAREEFVKFRIVGDADAEKPLSDENIVDEKNVISVIEDLIEKI